MEKCEMGRTCDRLLNEAVWSRTTRQNDRSYASRLGSKKAWRPSKTIDQSLDFSDYVTLQV